MVISYFDFFGFHQMTKIFCFLCNSDEEEEDFSQGVDMFLKTVKERRERRKTAMKTGDGLALTLGIENRLVACATWEKSYM